MTTRNRVSTNQADSWNEFRSRPTAQQLAERQGVKPIESMSDLVVEELRGEDIDELLALLDELHAISG